MHKNIIPSAIILAIALTASPAAAEPFTYQGQIQDAGAPANGTYDLRLQLFDAPVGGNQIGPTLTFDDITVTDGLFQVDPDFGAVFNQDDAYLFIQVREGTSAGGYTGLLPRTPLTATPKAQHATTADTLANPIWNQSGSVISNELGSSILLLNRSTTITPSEYFGIYRDFPGFVGMYVAGPSDSLPFYGYSIDNEISAYTYVDAERSWNLTINDTILAMRITAQGDASFAGGIRAAGQITQSYAPGTTDLATPIAYAFINNTGSVASGTPNVSSVWNNTLRRYEIEIENEDYFFNEYVTVVTSVSADISPRTSSSSGRLLVYLESTINQNDLQASFQFVTYKPNGAALVQGQRRPPLRPLNTPVTDEMIYPNLAPASPRQPIQPASPAPRQRD